MDGKIVIGTEIDTKQLETDLKKLGQKFEKLETQADKLQKRKIEIEVELKDTYKKEMDAIAKDYDDVVNKEFEFASKSEPTYGRKPPQKFMDWIDPIYQKRIDEVNKRYASQITSLNKINEKLKENANEQEIIKANIEEVNKELGNRKGLDAFLAGSKEINKSLTQTIKKVGRWALAVFGVRSAYLAIRQAMSILTNNDEQLKADIDFIKTALAYTLEPVVRGIVNLVKQIVQYVAYIIKAWTGRDIFAKASKNLASANKSAKELQKTSASFDKFNKLSGSGSASSAGGGATPSLEMPTDQEMEGTWIGWIAKHKDLILTVLAGIAAGLLTIKLIMLAINLANPLTWIALVVAAVVALAVLIALKWNEIKEMFAKFGSWFNEHIIKPIGDFFANLWQGIKNGFSNAITWIKNAFNNVVTFFKDIVDKIATLFKKIGTKAGEIVGGAFKAVVNGVLKAIETILNTPIKAINSLIKVINKVPGINLGNLNTFNLPRLAQGGIVYNPGVGVNMGNYIAGEGKNPEAVIPLDDATLDRLGQAIARHSQINATIVNEMDGRVLSKNLARVQSENAFARNGGY